MASPERSRLPDQLPDDAGQGPQGAGPQKLAEKPIGTGPFRFVEWKRDDRLVLERNPDYWAGPDDPSRVTFRFIPEFSARMVALLAGEIDIMKAVTIVDPKGRAAAYAELQQLLRDEAPWVFLWQQHDLYGVANTVERSPRPDEKVWMYEARIAAR